MTGETLRFRCGSGTVTLRPSVSLTWAPVSPLGQLPSGRLAVRSHTMAVRRKNRTATTGGPLRNA